MGVVFFLHHNPWQNLSCIGRTSLSRPQGAFVRNDLVEETPCVATRAGGGKAIQLQGEDGEFHAAFNGVL